jgi:CreA protein
VPHQPSPNWGHEGRSWGGSDTSDASIACRQIGPIKIKSEIKDGERVFDERRSVLFKTLQVARFFDKQRNVPVYVAYSDRIIEGSPKNSISSVPIMSWPEQ